MAPNTLESFAKYVLTPGGMQLVVGWLTSVFAEEWPWFCGLSAIRKRLVIWGLCGVFGTGAQMVVFGDRMSVDAVYVAWSLAFMVSQAVDLRNLAKKG